MLINLIKKMMGHGLNRFILLFILIFVGCNNTNETEKLFLMTLDQINEKKDLLELIEYKINCNDLSFFDKNELLDFQIISDDLIIAYFTSKVTIKPNVSVLVEFRIINENVYIDIYTPDYELISKDIYNELIINDIGDIDYDIIIVNVIIDGNILKKSYTKDYYYESNILFDPNIEIIDNIHLYRYN